MHAYPINNYVEHDLTDIIAAASYEQADDDSAQHAAEVISTEVERN